MSNRRAFIITHLQKYSKNALANLSQDALNRVLDRLETNLKNVADDDIEDTIKDMPSNDLKTIIDSQSSSRPPALAAASSPFVSLPAAPSPKMYLVLLMRQLQNVLQFRRRPVLLTTLNVHLLRFVRTLLHRLLCHVLRLPHRILFTLMNWTPKPHLRRRLL